MKLRAHFHNYWHRPTTTVRVGLAAIAACFISGSVLSNPVNPVFVNGSGSVSQAGSVLTVTNSNGAIIDWDKFSIQAGETTRFLQPSAASSVLNRVLNDPTVIYGTLSSNGSVWLVNPAGIMVGPGGRVDTAGFVASTINIRNEDFLAGRKQFGNTPGASSVVNQGQISTPAGGSVYLIGSNVANEGIITTPNGETILAAGATVSLIDSATPGVKVDITGSEGNATNLGSILAEAGRIGIAGVMVRNGGILSASSILEQGGRIFLKASQDVYVDGRILTTGLTGGSVEISGNQVVMADTSIDAGTGAVVVSGTASFDQTDGALTVTNSNGAISNWDKFFIKLGETTHFDQTTASSSVLNLALNDPTTTYGTLSSKRRVWLVNPAGIIVGPSGRIDVADHVAKTLNAASAEFHFAHLRNFIDGTFQNLVNQRLTTSPVGNGIYLAGKAGKATVPGGPSVSGTLVSLIDSATPGVMVDIIGASAGDIKATAARVGIAGALVRNLGTRGGQ